MEVTIIKLPTSVLSLILFGKPDEGVEPLAPKGAVIFEDDTVACKSALDELDKCFREQVNCCLGYGAWMNFYAGPNATQPNPKKYANNRFKSATEVFSTTNRHNHLDYI